MNRSVYFALALGQFTFSDVNALRADDPKLFPITEYGPNFPEPGSLKSGFIDETGKVVIPLTPDYMVIQSPRFPHCFVDGLQPVIGGLNGKWRPNSWGYIDAKGNFALKPQFGQAEPFSEGVAAVDGTMGPVSGRGYIDHTGRFVIPPVFATAGPFWSGRAVVQNEGDWHFGAIDHNGKLVVPAQYPSMGDFHDGLAYVGKYVTPRDQPPYAGEQAPMAWGFIDINGKLVIDFKFKEPGSFSEGVAAVSNNDSCGYIDKTGAYVIPPQFTWGSEFSEGLARVETKDGEPAFIDHQGKVVFRLSGLTHTEPFSEGLAETEIRDPSGHSPNRFLHGFIDRTGHFVIPPTYWGASSFHNGLAFVVGEKEEGYINKSGQFIWKSKAPDLKKFEESFRD